LTGHGRPGHTTRVKHRGRDAAQRVRVLPLGNRSGTENGFFNVPNGNVNSHGDGNVVVQIDV
jgi:hypothetical protein